jgi:multicomponent Na+:H+ antiporter subunit D
MSFTLVAPILIPLATAALSLLAWRSAAAQRWLGVAGAAALLAAALALLSQVRTGGVAAVQMGDWPAPYGITLVADLLAAIMVVLAALTGLAVAVYSLANIDPEREAFGYYPLTHVLLAGVCGAFLTGDIFNLYVWFEVMLMASFVLLALGGRRAQLEGAIKYVTLNLISSAIFLTAVGILYGSVGTLNFADLHIQLQRLPQGLATTIGVLFLVVFGVKAAVFPLFFWLPASYHTPPAAVSAVFAGLLTKVGVYALIRVFTLLFVGDMARTHTLILWISAATMLTGVLGAVAQSEFRRVLSFHIVSQIGYMILGLGLFGVVGSPRLAIFALAGSVFYIMHHIIVKTNLFLISGIARRMLGTGELAAMGGLYRAAPGLSLAFLVAAMSLAGLPPLSGFFAKLALVQAGLAAGRYTVVAVALAVSLLTLLSMMKIWREAFWKPAPADAPQPRARGGAPPAMWLPVAGLAAITVAVGLAAGPMFNLALDAAAQLHDPAAYLEAVRGGPS